MTTTIQPFFTGSANIALRGGTVDESVIGGDVPADGSFLALNASGVITGTDATAASAYGTGAATGVAAAVLAGGVEVSGNSFFGAGVEVAGVSIVSDATPTGITDSTGAGALGSAALQLTGGFEASQRSYVGADFLVGGVLDTNSTIVGRDATATTSVIGAVANDGAMQLAGGAEILGNSYFGAGLQVEGDLAVGGTLTATISETVMDPTEWVIPGAGDNTAPAIDSAGIWIFRPQADLTASGIITGTLNFPSPAAGDRVRIFISAEIASGAFPNLEAFELELTDGYYAANGTALDATGTPDVFRFTSRGQSITLIYVDDGTDAGWMNENAGAFIEQRT